MTCGFRSYGVAGGYFSWQIELSTMLGETEQLRDGVEQRPAKAGGEFCRPFQGGSEMRIVGLCWLGAIALVALGESAYAEGDATKGKAAFAKCAICHQVGPGAKTLVGPELNSVVGRKAASIADYTMYSAGMKKLGDSGWVWTEENIDKWIANPKAMIPDSTMSLAFVGIPDAEERADIIAYLKAN